MPGFGGTADVLAQTLLRPAIANCGHRAYYKILDQRACYIYRNKAGNHAKVSSQSRPAAAVPHRRERLCGVLGSR